MMNFEQNNASFKRILNELRRLKRIHDATVYSYSQTREHVEEMISNRKISSDTILTASIAGNKEIIAKSPFELLKRLSSTYPQILRESLFVRAISQFEVFLVDTVWEIADRTIEPFKQKNRTLEYQQAQLLSFKNIKELQEDIIQQECRQLTSQGFNYSTKYYESRFGIRFTDSKIPLSEIREMHERRHLLVHRGGKIDARYKKLFEPKLEIDQQIEISEDYFNHALETLIGLAQFVISSVEKQWPHTEPVRQNINEDLLKAWSIYVDGVSASKLIIQEDTTINLSLE